MDLYSRKVIGWSMDKNMGRYIAMNDLGMAIAVINPRNGVIIHSYRGAQYLSDAYQAMLKENGIQCSMSARGNCYDNEVVERFFGSLKRERICRYKYRIRQKTRLLNL